MSVWTGRDLMSAQKILAHNGIDKYMRLCVGRTCVPNNKPYPDGLLKILKESQQHSDDVVMIGDHEYDMQGAKAAKVKGISVSWDHRPHIGAREISDLHFNRIADLMAYAQSTYT